MEGPQIRQKKAHAEHLHFCPLAWLSALLGFGRSHTLWHLTAQTTANGDEPEARGRTVDAGHP